MRYFIDTEFIEDGHTIELLSIGMVCEDGREFYAQVEGADLSKASDWVKANVLPHLQPSFQPRASVREMVRNFCDPEQHGKPEFWGYYADYDWVALCQLFGTMMDLPKRWPMYCRDLKQLCDDWGNPQLPAEGKDEHHALADAKWNKMAFEWLCSVGRRKFEIACGNAVIGYAYTEADAKHLSKAYDDRLQDG